MSGRLILASTVEMGGHDCARGLLGFGRVTGAGVIGTHHEHAASGDSSRTFPVADLVVHSARGPAVIELAFDNGGLVSEEVTGVYELDPDDAPGLPPRDREQLVSAYAERDGFPVNEFTLKQATARARHPSAPWPPKRRRCGRNGAPGGAEERSSCGACSAPAVTWRSSWRALGHSRRRRGPHAQLAHIPAHRPAVAPHERTTAVGDRRRVRGRGDGGS